MTQPVAPRTLRSKRLLVLMLAGLTAVYVAIAVIQVRQVTALNQVMQRNDREALWTVLQLESEYLRFDNALTHRVLAPGSMPLEQLQLRYDIFVSRVASLNDSSTRGLISDQSLFNSTQTELTDFVAQADHFLGPQPDRTPLARDLLALRKGLDTLQGPIRALAVDASQSSALAVDNRTAEVKSQLITTSALTAFLCALTLLFAITTLRQNRKREEAQEAALHSELELANAAARLEKEALLVAAREELHEITDALPLAIFRARTEASGRFVFTYISQQIEEVWGLPAQTILDDISAFLGRAHPEDIRNLRRFADVSGESVDSFNQNIRVQNNAGEMRWVNVSATPRRLADGAIVWTGFVRSIHDLKQRDERLREVLEQQTVIFENIPLGLIFSADGNIQQVNAGFASIVGAEREAIVGKSAGFLYASAAAHEAFNARAVPQLDAGQRVWKRWCSTVSTAHRSTAECPGAACRCKASRGRLSGWWKTSANASRWKPIWQNKRTSRAHWWTRFPTRCFTKVRTRVSWA